MSKIPASSIEIPAALYPRSKRPTEKDVQHLLGVDFPPITVATLEDDGATVLVDGAHRLTATILEHGPEAEIEVDDIGVMRADHILTMAVALNAKHGKQLSMRDKEKCAARMAVAGHTNGEIIEALGAAERTVTRWVADARQDQKVKQFAAAQKLRKAGASVTAAAKEVGVSRSTLQGWEKDPPKKAERPDPAPPAPKGDGYTEIPGKAPAKGNRAIDRYDERADTVAGMVIEAAKDIAREDDQLGWPEFCHAVIERVRKAYPRDWKGYEG